MRILANIVLACAAFLLANQAPAAECNEVKGKVLIEQERYTQALRVLKSCEKRRGVSADTLMSLATLYERSVAKISKKETALRHAWSLKHKAAIQGNLEALIAITKAYALGDNDLKLRPNIERHECLVDVVHTAAGHGKYESEAVISCLKG